MTTLDEAERELRAALDSGDLDRIAAATAAVDELDVRPDPVPLVSAALWYAEQGLHVFPIGPGGKMPLPACNYCSKARGGPCTGPQECGHDHCHGCKDATTDRDRLIAWWTEFPQANVGLATGHRVDVVDIDGPAGQVSRCANWGAFSALDVIGVVTTPRPGGMHMYVPASGRGNKTALFDHVDYRGLGGYVVAPPSIITESYALANGCSAGPYQWLRPLDLATASEVA